MTTAASAAVSILILCLPARREVRQHLANLGFMVGGVVTVVSEMVSTPTEKCQFSLNLPPPWGGCAFALVPLQAALCR